MYAQQKLITFILLLSTGCNQAWPAAESKTPEELLEQAIAYEKQAFSLKSDAERKKIVTLYRQAAQAGSTRALGILAAIYAFGEYEVIPDHGACQSIALRAMAAGDPLGAMAVLGCPHTDKHSRSRANRILANAYEVLVEEARSGDARAAYVLASMHTEGIATQRDQEDLFRWAKQAAQSLPIGAYLYGFCLERGFNREPDWAAAMRQYERAAGAGIAAAALRLAHIHGEGIVVDRSLSETRRWASIAARLNSPRGQFAMGQVHAFGFGGEKDLDEAVKWFTRAAENGDPNACFQLGVMHENGKGNLKQDYERSAELYRKAADQGHAEAQCNLGRQYLVGLGVEMNHSLAMQWYREAAKGGNAVAQCNLAICLFQFGQETDWPEAIEWLGKSAALGEPRAIESLNKIEAYQVALDAEKKLEQLDREYQLEMEGIEWAAQQDYKRRTMREVQRAHSRY